jgi:transcriptional regulator GlxA family with amidase domain
VPSRTETRRAEVWRAIERYAANPKLAASCDLLCRETGVCARTLHNICHASSGQSPIAYIKRRRMTLAHSMLHHAGPDTTVAGIARLCGFSDLGRFSIRYHQLYGQPPSQTLRQQPSRL